MTAFDLQRIKAETFVQSVDFHEELGSTNDRALELSRRGDLVTPLLVLANRQNAGRGRGGHRWWSTDEALTFSFIIDSQQAPLPPARRPQLSLTAGLAVCEVLAGLLPGAAVGLKWPNDVHLESRKVCGILVEVPPHREDTFVIGIGVNVNNLLTDAPEELRATATSLFEIGRRTFGLTDVLIRLLRQFAEELPRLVQNPSRLADRWQPYCVLTGRLVRLDGGRRPVTGICQGIDADGALLLETEAGVERFFGGTVSLPAEGEGG